MVFHMRQMRVWRRRSVMVSLIGLPVFCIACSRKAVDVKGPEDAKPAVRAPVAAGATTPIAREVCEAKPEWLDPKAPYDLFKEDAPPNHTVSNSDCPFYQAAWRVFLYATRPVPLVDSTGKTTIVPQFLASSDFFTIEQVFGQANLRNLPKKRDDTVLSLAVKSLQRANSSVVQKEPAIGAGVGQAKTSPCVDQNGNPLYYAIHFNGVMKDFFTQPIMAKPTVNLLTAAGFEAAQQEPEFSTLEFPPGSIELKSAWQIVDEANLPEGYFVVKASLPALKIETDPMTKQTSLVIDQTKPVQARSVALLAIHVVFTLKGHPEFVWSTFQHVDKSGDPDTAPSASHNPDMSPAVIETTGTKFALFKSRTPIADANKLVTSADILAHFDETKQSFTKTGNTFQTSIYRVYPASLADGAKPIDGEVQAVNDSMANIFKSPAFNLSGDHRDRFRLVGAVWMDEPKGNNPSKQFGPGIAIRNDPGQSPDDPKSMVAGEDRLSSTAMESFSQFDSSDPFSFPNCFSCHDTRPIHDGNTKIKPSTLNVSHVLSRYLVDAPSPSPPPAPKP